MVEIQKAGEYTVEVTRKATGDELESVSLNLKKKRGKLMK